METFEQLHRPIVVDERRVSALRFGDPRIQALLAALLTFRLLPMGFANREWREQVAPLLDVSADAYGSGRASYDLRRLRLRGLVERLPRSHRYRVAEAGQRIALCYCRGQRRVLAPARSALFDDKAPPALGRLVARFDHHIHRLDGRAGARTGLRRSRPGAGWQRAGSTPRSTRCASTAR